MVNRLDRWHEAIALRCVASGHVVGQPRDVEVAAFLEVVDGEPVEMRCVADVVITHPMREAAPCGLRCSDVSTGF